MSATRKKYMFYPLQFQERQRNAQVSGSQVMGYFFLNVNTNFYKWKMLQKSFAFLLRKRFAVMSRFSRKYWMNDFSHICDKFLRHVWQLVDLQPCCTVQFPIQRLHTRRLRFFHENTSLFEYNILPRMRRCMMTSCPNHSMMEDIPEHKKFSIAPKYSFSRINMLLLMVNAYNKNEPKHFRLRKLL